MSLVHHNVSKYMRLQDGSGNAISSSAGALSVDLGASDVTSATHNNFNVNANLQISDIDLAFGQALMTSSLPVAISSDQSALNVSSELPTAAVLSDNAGNPTAPAVGAHGMVWDGAAWDRMPGSDAGVTIKQSSHDSLQCNANIQVGDADVNASNAVPVQGPAVGSHANASSAQVTAAPDEDSTNSIDCQYVSKLVAFGSVDGACTIKLLQSQDDSNYYETGISYTASGAEDFHMSLDGAARYHKLQYSASGTTVTATIAGKQ